MTRRTLLVAVLLLVTWSVPTLSSAQNLLSNPDFASFWDWVGSGSWVPEDCCGDPQSGSATYINQFPGPYGVYIARQCVELMVPGEYYELSGLFHIPSGQSGSGWGQLGVSWYSSASCVAGDYIDGADAPIVTATGLWQETTTVIRAPLTAVSAYVYTYNHKSSSGGVFQVSTDHLFFAVTDKIFTDGFETGDTTRWSTTVP